MLSPVNRDTGRSLGRFGGFGIRTKDPGITVTLMCRQVNARFTQKSMSLFTL